MSRPAETGGGLGSAAIVLARLFGVKDADTLTGIGVLVGLIPAAVTWLVVTFKRKSATQPPVVKP